MSTTTSAKTVLEAPDLLAALDQQLTEDPIEQQRIAHRARRPRLLDLHLVPQLQLADAAAVFPVLDAGFPLEWKQQVRQLRNRLTHFGEEVRGREQQGIQIVSILSLHSQRPRRGLAANLAFSLAAMEDTKVLLIDAKGLAADMHTQLQDPQGKGLCDAVRAHREDLPSCFRRIAGTPLYLLPFGGVFGYEADPVDLRGLQRLLEGLRQQFDWILIDGPAFDSPADATLVTLCSDGTIYAIGQEQDRFEDLRQAFRQTQGRYMIGAVMV